MPSQRDAGYMRRPVVRHQTRLAGKSCPLCTRKLSGSRAAEKLRNTRRIRACLKETLSLWSMTIS
jgi:hypothetical protein